jgi:isoquinoline 1-oxidoreductase beta subunit
MLRNDLDPCVTRRTFLLSSGAAVVYVASCTRPTRAAAAEANRRRALTPWIAITEDNRIVVLVDKCEMGQGVRDLFASIVAEELGLAPSDVEVEDAPIGRAYRNKKLLSLPVDIALFQLTGSSSSVPDAWEKLREGAAGTRRLLLQRAASRFGVTETEVRLDGRDVRLNHGEGRASFAALLGDGRGHVDRITPSAGPFGVLGKSVTSGQRGPRIDAREKITGQARFGIDVGAAELGQVPLVALVVRPDRTGDSVEITNPADLLMKAGVKHLVTLKGDRGVAIVADSFWHAFKARLAAETRRVRRAGLRPSSATILERYRAAAERPVDTVAPVKDRDGAGSLCEATYETPYGPHAPMEPMTAACVLREERYHIYAATQFPDAARVRAARALQVLAGSVVIHGMLAGGSFGRRAASDFIVEVADICRQLDGRAVKLIWTREDDFQFDYVRPCAVSRVKATAAGERIEAWEQTIVSESANVRMGDEYAAALGVIGPVLTLIPFQWRRTQAHVDFIDALIQEGIKDTLYTMNPRVHRAKAPDPGIVQVGYWRSVGRFHTIFAVESAIDELAASADVNPVEFRLANLQGDAPKRPGARERMGWCLDRVVRHVERDKFARRGADWRSRGYGLACFSGWGSFAALAVEVSVRSDDRAQDIKVHRAWAAVDCGFVLCPDVLRQQVEGGIIFGLSAALKQEITTVDGIVQQTNFHACDALRIHECPEIKVEYRNDSASTPPTGVGELMVPLPAPAVANAVYNATGRRLRSVPLTLRMVRG